MTRTCWKCKGENPDYAERCLWCNATIQRKQSPSVIRDLSFEQPQRASGPKTKEKRYTDMDMGIAIAVACIFTFILTSLLK